ncbi:MAG: helix-turn-helix domain-containing protein [Bacteroidetes bacterium]|nr:helix-turn-helix domain-containing protein [Bacteroidota bacterium]
MDLQSIMTKLNGIEKMLLSNKTILNLEELAEYTGYATSYLYKMTCTQKIPCFRPNGKKLFFKKSEIDEWLLRNRSKTHLENDAEAISYVMRNRK